MLLTTRKCIDANDFDNLVEATYGRPFCYQQQDGCKARGSQTLTVPDNDGADFDRESIPEKVNGTVRGVSFKAWLARDPAALVGERTEDYTIILFWYRNFYPEISMVVNDLHERGLLDAGDYSLIIDW